jgi:hypothetical protein
MRSVSSERSFAASVAGGGGDMEHVSPAAAKAGPGVARSRRSRWRVRAVVELDQEEEAVVRASAMTKSTCFCEMRPPRHATPPVAPDDVPTRGPCARSKPAASPRERVVERRLALAQEKSLGEYEQRPGGSAARVGA